MYRPLSLATLDRRETKQGDGYVLVYAPEHPKAFGGGWYYLHRMVAEAEMGRVLHGWETVHHLATKQDNHWEALFVCTRKEHDYAV